MFDILMYLFENLVHSDAEIYVDHDELTEELVRAGFHLDEIYKALSWLEKLAALQETSTTPYLSKRITASVNRIYTHEESLRLDRESQGFMLFLEQLGVIDANTREMVIDRVMEIDASEFCLEDLKWVVLMVLFNVPGKENAYEQMEELLFEVPDGPLH
jgi:Smg protein